MTKEQFLSLVSLHVETYYQSAPDRKHECDWNRKGKFKLRKGKLLEEIGLDDVILTEWKTGGVSGGSCWNDGDCHYPEPGEPEPVIRELDTLLEAICPDISYFQYKKLMENLVEYDDYTDYEYYGNSTSYGIKFIKLANLYERLKSLNLLIG